MFFQALAPPSIAPRLRTRPTFSLAISTMYGVLYRYNVTPYSCFYLKFKKKHQNQGLYFFQNSYFHQKYILNERKRFCRTKRIVKSRQREKERTSWTVGVVVSVLTLRIMSFCICFIVSMVKLFLNE